MKWLLVVSVLAALALVGCELEEIGEQATTEDRASKKKDTKARQWQVLGVLRIDAIAETSAEVVIATNGKKWLAKFCNEMDTLGPELALQRFKRGYGGKKNGVSARKVFNAIADHC